LKEKAYRPSFNRLNASNDGIRNVFKFKLVAVENVSDESAAEELSTGPAERSRIIPTDVKWDVWVRDENKRPSGSIRMASCVRMSGFYSAGFSSAAGPPPAIFARVAYRSLTYSSSMASSRAASSGKVFLREA
jgi:hypothetical protein